eukprot:GABV01008830.1.p1 GENE.GABV01008830.1~~GABV01008830.1.p1  ORF type:complete len:227 (-),score=67.35 GABV01008830.1:244-924(-)
MSVVGSGDADFLTSTVLDDEWLKDIAGPVEPAGNGDSLTVPSMGSGRHSRTPSTGSMGGFVDLSSYRTEFETSHSGFDPRAMMMEEDESSDVAAPTPTSTSTSTGNGAIFDAEWDRLATGPTEAKQADPWAVGLVNVENLRAQPAAKQQPINPKKLAPNSPIFNARRPPSSSARCRSRSVMILLGKSMNLWVELCLKLWRQKPPKQTRTGCLKCKGKRDRWCRSSV